MTQRSLDDRLAALEAMPLAQLREEWKNVCDGPVPRVSAALLRLAIAWELQAAVLGGLSRKTRQTLDQLAGGRTRCCQSNAKRSPPAALRRLVEPA